MDISEDRRGSTLVIVPSGRIDSSAASDFKRHMDAVIERGDAQIVIDMTHLEYISSMGLSVFLSSAKKVTALDGGLALAGLNNRVRLAFEMSGFLQLFPVYATLDAAIAK